MLEWVSKSKYVLTMAMVSLTMTEQFRCAILLTVGTLAAFADRYGPALLCCIVEQHDVGCKE